MSCGARLAPFDIAELREVTAYDELELDTLGDEKTALLPAPSEYKKNAAKIAELQARQSELTKQRTELENLDIIGMVRGVGLDPDQLAALIHAARSVKQEDTDHGEM